MKSLERLLQRLVILAVIALVWLSSLMPKNPGPVCQGLSWGTVFFIGLAIACFIYAIIKSGVGLPEIIAAIALALAIIFLALAFFVCSQPQTFPAIPQLG